MVFVRDFQNIKAPAVAEKALTFWLTIFSFLAFKLSINDAILKLFYLVYSQII